MSKKLLDKSAMASNSVEVIKFEVVNLDNKQLTNFSEKWWRAKDPVKAKKFTSLLKENERIKQLATNPLLLTLLCLVFEETSEFPSNSLQLYKEGLEILLKKWDASHNIERELVYKKLSPQQKEDLLSYIALKSFERGNYFFKQKELEQYIADYIRNLLDAQTNLEELQLDSSAVLKSISAQHGLLVEKAKGIYSFSDVTLHEYFTAREITIISDPQALEKALQNLGERITETRWREVFLLAAGMLRNADYLLSLMKRQIDALVASDRELQNFLAWSNQKSISGKAPYKPSAFRAITIEFVLDLDFDFAPCLDDKLAYDLGFNPALIHTHTHQLQNSQFTLQQKKALKQYYDANKLLVDCLNNAHYVTRTVREEIEEALLVPNELGIN